MQEIRIGFETGLTKEQVEFYAKSYYNSHQMLEIKEGFKNED